MRRRRPRARAAAAVGDRVRRGLRRGRRGRSGGDRRGGHAGLRQRVRRHGNAESRGGGARIGVLCRVSASGLTGGRLLRRSARSRRTQAARREGRRPRAAERHSGRGILQGHRAAGRRADAAGAAAKGRRARRRRGGGLRLGEPHPRAAHKRRVRRRISHAGERGDLRARMRGRPRAGDDGKRRAGDPRPSACDARGGPRPLRRRRRGTVPPLLRRRAARNEHRGHSRRGKVQALRLCAAAAAAALGLPRSDGGAARAYPLSACARV